MLHYRIPRRKGRNVYDAPREDAARAIRHLRANAAKFGWSPEKIGAVGFSAGAHLAAVSATSSQDALGVQKGPRNLLFAKVCPLSGGDWRIGLGVLDCRGFKWPFPGSCGRKLTTNR